MDRTQASERSVALRERAKRSHDRMGQLHERAERENRALGRNESEEFARHDGDFKRSMDEAKDIEARFGISRGNAAVEARHAAEHAEGTRRISAEGDGGDLRDADGNIRRGALLASEMRAISSVDAGTGAALTPVEQASVVLAGLEARSVFLRAGPVIVPTDRTELRIPHETGDTASLADWVAEGAEIAEATPPGEGIPAIPRKVASLVTASNESVTDSEPALLEHLENRLLRALALKADLGFFEGSGAAPQIRGLANVAGVSTVSVGAAPTNLDPWAEAVGQVVEDDGEEDRVAVFMHGRTWKDLLQLKADSSGSNVPLVNQVDPTGAVTRAIYGRPVYITSQLSTTETSGANSDASSSYVVDMSRVIVVERKLASVEVDRSSAFTSDSTRVRAIARLDLVVPDAEAVNRVEGIRPAA